MIFADLANIKVFGIFFGVLSVQSTEMKNTLHSFSKNMNENILE